MVGVVNNLWSNVLLVHSFTRILCFFVGYNEAGVSSAFRFGVLVTFLIIIGWSIFFRLVFLGSWFFIGIVDLVIKLNIDDWGFNLVLISEDFLDNASRASSDGMVTVE